LLKRAEWQAQEYRVADVTMTQIDCSGLGHVVESFLIEKVIA
jgi:hypothetical protein